MDIQQFFKKHGQTVLTAVILLTIIILLILFREQVTELFDNADRAKTFFRNLGFWGPFLLILINIVQTVIAPIPGYAVYIGAGFIYGTLWGGIWGAVGMLLGGMTAMAVGRNLGRPVVQRIIGKATLERWEKVAHSDSTTVWALILLSPIGDSPFLLAGLSKVRYRTIFILTLIVRAPTTFAASAVGAGAVALTWWQLILIIGLVSVPFIIISRYQEAITDWFYNYTERLAKRP